MLLTTGYGLVNEKRSRDVMSARPFSIFDQQWNVIRGRSVEWFSLLGEHDLKKINKAAHKQDRFLTMLQVKYGYTR
jgi:hypothetical protein